MRNKQKEICSASLMLEETSVSRYREKRTTLIKRKGEIKAVGDFTEEKSPNNILFPIAMFTVII